MTLTELHHRIGRIRATAAPLARELSITDFTAECHGHPLQGMARARAAMIRRELQRLYTRLHALEARIPTPDTLSAAAYGRALALGLTIEDAEAARSAAYFHAQRDARLRAA
ncbi:MAG: hypothetical protein HS117_19340 [Verrucomicrobiaceae bacterium]|nr:hypothetical protein [Verrucomicrobiaceae bacterium]